MKFGTIVLQVSINQLVEWDYWHDVIFSRWQPWRSPAARCTYAVCSSIRWLPASPSSACDVIGSLCLLQFLICITLVVINSVVAL